MVFGWCPVVLWKLSSPVGAFYSIHLSCSISSAEFLRDTLLLQILRAKTKYPGNHLSVWNFRQCWETELNKTLASVKCRKWNGCHYIAFQTTIPSFKVAELHIKYGHLMLMSNRIMMRERERERERERM